MILEGFCALRLSKLPINNVCTDLLASCVLCKPCVTPASMPWLTGCIAVTQVQAVSLPSDSVPVLVRQQGVDLHTGRIFCHQGPA